MKSYVDWRGVEGANIVPVSIRADFMARVYIPTDLTEAEARRIAAVVIAMAIPARGDEHD